MEKIIWKSCDIAAQKDALKRPVQAVAGKVEAAVSAIREDVRQNGDQAVIALTEKFDRVSIDSLILPESEFERVENRLSDEFKAAIKRAYDNITKFHEAQKPGTIEVETEKGVLCEVLTRPIESVGLYIPGGTAPLFSTVLMLAVPAKIAGCQEIVLASPPQLADEIIYAAKLCGITTIYQMGGAQAIFALGLGTETVKKVDKIFGPGN